MQFAINVIFFTLYTDIRYHIVCMYEPEMRITPDTSSKSLILLFGCLFSVYFLLSFCFVLFCFKRVFIISISSAASPLFRYHLKGNNTQARSISDTHRTKYTSADSLPLFTHFSLLAAIHCNRINYYYLL